MTIAILLTDLLSRGVVVTLAGDSIELDAPVGVLTHDDIAALRDHKSDVLNSLRGRCKYHNNANNYTDAPDDRRPGWVRSTCRLCGCFVGYRDTTRYTHERNG